MKNYEAYRSTLERQGLPEPGTPEAPGRSGRLGGLRSGTRPPRSDVGVRGVTTSVSVRGPSTGAAPLRGTESPGSCIWAGEKKETSFEAKILRILGGNRKL